MAVMLEESPSLERETYGNIIGEVIEMNRICFKIFQEKKWKGWGGRQTIDEARLVTC